MENKWRNKNFKMALKNSMSGIEYTIKTQRNLKIQVICAIVAILLAVTLKLTPIEYNILLLLMKNQGKVFSISEIYQKIWNAEAIGADNTVAVHIRHIREKIEINPKEPRYIKVVWGVGYKIDKV